MASERGQPAKKSTQSHGRDGGFPTPIGRALLRFCAICPHSFALGGLELTKLNSSKHSLITVKSPLLEELLVEVYRRPYLFK